MRFLWKLIRRVFRRSIIGESGILCGEDPLMSTRQTSERSPCVGPVLCTGKAPTPGSWQRPGSIGRKASLVIRPGFYCRMSGNLYSTPFDAF